MEGSGGFNNTGYGSPPGTSPPQQPYPGFDPNLYDPQAYQYGMPNLYGGFDQTFPPPQRFNGMAIASLSCGGASILMIAFGMLMSYCMLFLGPLAIICSLVGVVLGIIGLNQINKDSSYKGRGLAIAGLITSGVTLILALMGILLVVLIVAMFVSMPMGEMILFDFAWSVGVVI